MCQISVVVAQDGGEEKLMDNVTSLDVIEDGVVLSAFFEEPKTVPGVVIARIDFLGGKVVLGRSRGH
ncbi:MAG TPA: RNA-binding protein [Desulfobulbaceae bacterium]|jgi:predicted RNA-binding protein|nr:RNA-binding protein [Desulfobulbaceae bacterium]